MIAKVLWVGGVFEGCRFFDVWSESYSVLRRFSKSARLHHKPVNSVY